MRSTALLEGSNNSDSLIISWLTNFKFQFLVAILALGLILFYDVANYVFLPYDGLEISSRMDGRVVIVDLNSPADKAGIKVEDRILAIDHLPLDPLIRRPLFRAWISPGDELVYDVQRGNQVINIPVRMGSRFDNWNSLIPTVGAQFLALVFWGMGVLLSLFVKIKDVRSRLVGLCWFLAGVAMAAGESGMEAEIWGSDLTMETAWCLLGLTMIAAHLYFPEVAFSSRVRKRILGAFALIAVSLAVINAVQILVLKPQLLSLNQFGISTNDILSGFFALSILFSIGLLLYNRFREVNPDVKRQTGIILWGMILGFTPFLGFTLIPILLLGSTSGYIDGRITILFLVLLPLAYFYVINQRRLLRVDFVINQFVVFFIQSLLVLLLSFTVLAAVAVVFNLPRELPLAGGLIFLLLFWPSLRIQSTVHERVDRVLYGSHYDFSTVTASLSSRLAQALDRETLTQLLTQILAGQMGIKRTALFITTADRLVLQGEDRWEVSVSIADELCQHLLKRRIPVRAQHLWASLPVSVTESWQKFEWAQLFAPIIFKDELLGILILGTRTSGDLFSDQDVRIIAAVAQQGALASANVQLIEELHGINQQLVRADETHRKKLAIDLHDMVLQDLYFIKQGMMMNHPNSELLAEMDEVILHLRQTIEAQRPTLLDSGIALALQHLVEDVRPFAGQSRPMITWQMNVKSDLSLDEEQATSIYRIAQEALTNAIRHASASQIRVALEKEDGGPLILRVEDDGKGITDIKSKNLLIEQHFGFKNMEERASMIHGILKINSQPELGTCIKLEVAL